MFEKREKERLKYNLIEDKQFKEDLAHRFKIQNFQQNPKEEKEFKEELS